MARMTLRWWIGIAVAVSLVAWVSLGVVLLGTSQRGPLREWSAWAWEMRYKVFALDDRTELVELHGDAAHGIPGKCAACHGDKVDSGLLVHRIHLQSELLATLACPDCHRHVDLEPRGSTTAVIWVDVGFCKMCHSTFPAASDPEAHSAGLKSDCAGCHTGELAVRHEQPYLSSAIPPSECKGCHGGRVLPWTPRHEQDGWLAVHGTEALGSGSERCFECHDFGLKFCDECHSHKPPSHMPAEEWRVRHPNAARDDTRVCYTCHPTGFCKGCHINHENGWMTAHPAFVAESGSLSCTECHSESSCSYCHTAVREGAVLPSVSP